MADNKISVFPSNTNPAVEDLIPNVDVSDLSQAPTGTNKKSTLQAIADWLASLTQILTNKTLTSPVINTGISGTAKATAAEVTTGTDDTKIVTPKALADAGLTSTPPNILVTASPVIDHLASGIKIALTATANMAFGDVGYIASTGKVTLIDADAIASMSGLVMCCDATINADASGNFLLMGVARDDTWAWTVGGLIYGTVTGTSGNTLSQTAPTGTDDVVQILGVALTADIMLFNPQLPQVELV